MSNPISTAALLRVMILKEIRTTFRERAQLRGLIISVIVLVVALGSGMSQFFRHPRYHPVVPTFPMAATASRPANTTMPQMETPAETDTPFGHTPQQARLVRWGAIGGATSVSFFFSMGYLIASCLAAFVGEKEAKTLEILLASPMSDRKLFFIKCVSVFLPSALLGYLFAAAILLLLMVFVPAELIELPPSLPVYALVVGLPIILLPQIFFLGLGAAISAKAETFKGASQAFSGILMLIIFGGIYGTPLLFYFVPAVRQPALAFGLRLLDLSFSTQYATVFLALAIPAITALAVARAFFRRDRMLT